MVELERWIERISELEADLPESEGRLLQAIAEVKAELKSDIAEVWRVQDLHTQALARLLDDGPLFSHEKQALREKMTTMLPDGQASVVRGNSVG